MSAESPESTVLLVERDQAVRDLQGFFLKRAGLTPVFFDNGQSALDSAILSPPAVVVTEILIPGMDGLALCRRLSEHPATRTTPVLVFSILAAAGRAQEAGAKAFLRKPLVESSFIDTIQELLAAHPTEMEGQWASR